MLALILASIFLTCAMAPFISLIVFSFFAVSSGVGCLSFLTGTSVTGFGVDGPQQLSFLRRIKLVAFPFILPPWYYHINLC